MNNMVFSNKTHLLLMILLLVSLACSVSDIFTPDTKAVNTSVAQTVIAMVTQNTLQATFSSTLEATPTFAPELTIFTPTQILTATPAFTPTPLIPLISVSVNTNCRSGPGKVYDLEGALLIGEVVEVYGRDPTSNYWYIRNPDSDPEFCWVWGKYATLTGPASLLPAFTPPPTPTATATTTPTPTFNADYASLDTCNGSWWGEVKLKNTGSIPFKSVDISVKDKLTDIVLVNLADGFTNMDGCLAKTTKDILGPGDTYLLSAPAFAYNPAGHNLLLVITLCSDTGQKGMCATKKIDFAP
jgi:hypothetical protein